MPLRAKENTVTAKYTYEAKSMLSHEDKYQTTGKVSITWPFLSINYRFYSVWIVF